MEYIFMWLIIFLVYEILVRPKITWLWYYLINKATK
jgi:hypothetical protein